MITVQQKNTYEFIKEYYSEKGMSPTTIEIAEGIGISSRGVVYRYLKALEDNGLIKFVPNKKRNIVVCDNDDQIDNFSLPLLGKIAAGRPLEIFDNNSNINFTDKLIGKNRFILEVSGDSMIGDNICDGDFIICEKHDQILPKEILVLVIDNSETTLKRCKANADNTVTLIPSNPNQPEQTYDIGRVSVQGKFIGLLRID